MDKSRAATPHVFYDDAGRYCVRAQRVACEPVAIHRVEGDRLAAALELAGALRAAGLLRAVVWPWREAK